MRSSHRGIQVSSPCYRSTVPYSYLHKTFARQSSAVRFVSLSYPKIRMEIIHNIILRSGKSRHSPGTYKSNRQRLSHVNTSELSPSN
jgi:hypothetical protein